MIAKRPRIGLRPPRLTRRGRPPLRRLLPDLALGAIAALGLAPFGIWAATPLALAVLIWRLARSRSGPAFWRAFAAGLGWFALAMFWIAEPFLVEPEIYGWMAPFAVILMAAGGALFWAIPTAIATRIASGWRGRAVAIAAALALSDWLRGWIFTGFPWAQIGQVWVDTPVAQLAAWSGALGLSALTLTMAALPAFMWRPNRAALLPGAAAAILILGAGWATGLSRLAAPLPADRDLVLRIVQPNATQALKWDPEWSQVFFDRLLDLSAAPGRRDLVIWPETAVNFLLEDATPVLPAMSQAAGAPLVMGIQRRDGARWLNSLAVIGTGGTEGQIYDKFHLVPFGEYIPWGDALARIGITAFAAQQGNGYSAGPGPQVMGIDGIPDFQPLICYEAIFPQHLRGLPERPVWLLQITNDAWFGKVSGPYQHLAQARLRAIETGLPLVRSANTGVSAVIDARGRVRDSLPLNEAGAMDAALPGALPETAWLRMGNTPLVLALMAIIGLTAIRRRFSRG
ncbi:apolipoprotein N-acyltransferase [Paracoccus sp. 1_MG-2023]|uniref:apolipoprotein N-acyltransferase n=1 Tax=unclassified Paracoccus (in: a-proteobacteria) TaxID=2688777 RepID=UPI001C0A02A4|nr:MULTISPECIES: apolipoprotein N-acyltransferase [unclassified Paracoccus (in: a-proteobacteria)]MBU2956450.1 apolipoprotein N-acyltransferase [Paracoccus sp. C2R09]MDO6669745.1 apolipoprotein N-acyltransferase [Paracoccus sp. 1_MG-2023]